MYWSMYWSWIRSRLWLIGVLAFVTFVYAYLASAGDIRADWPSYGDYHDRLADGFRAGQLSLPFVVDPELLNAKNPYDPVHMKHWLLDASYYKGKYYIYWGPVPALAQAIGKTVLRIHRMIGDEYVGFVFACMLAICGVLLIDRIARGVFNEIPRRLIVLCGLVFAFAHATPHAVTTLGTYHTAIVTAQAFLVAGLLPAFRAVSSNTNPSDAKLVHQIQPFVLAGTAWALAIASRVTVAPTVILLILITAITEAWSTPQRWKRMTTNAAILGFPVAAATFGLLLYNKARFDNWFEFGNKLQTSGFAQLSSSTMSVKYAIPNLYSYLFGAFKLSCRFPYVFQVWYPGSKAFPAGFPLPSGYMTHEPVIGWMLALPFAWLIPASFIMTRSLLREMDDRRARSFLFCLLAFAVLATTTGFVSLTVYSSTMRYLTDVTAGIVLLSVLGAFAIYRRWRGRGFPSRASAGLLGTLGVASIIMGLLIGYQGYNGHFYRHNPRLDAMAVKALSVCGRPPENPPAYLP